ncbi:MAG: fibronectin type III domain-containing protein [Treponema sp.]|nr:fibronectin type III domain-containing protein [Treponema sp.]
MAIKKLLAVALIFAIVSFNLSAKSKKKSKNKKGKESAPEAILPATEGDGATAESFGLEEKLPEENSTEENKADENLSEENKNAAPDSDNNHSRYTISAIEAPEPGLNYYVTKDENENIKFIQKLSWNKIADIKHYHITIERQGEEGWTEVLQKDLHDNRIEVSLEAGKYRFQVGIVNLFDQLEKSSDWKFFEVLKALQPKIEGYQTDSIYLNSKKATGIFTLKGENLTSGTLFTMEQRESDPPKIITGSILSVSPDGQSADVKFNIEEIEPGKYEIYAQNPGGLSVISKTIQIKQKKDRHWRFLASALYSCPFTFYDGTLNNCTKYPFYPLSGGFRLEVISFHTKRCDIGFGLGGYYSFLSNDNDKMSMTGHYVNAMGYLVCQKQLIPQKLCLDVHAGAGAAALVDMRFTNKFFESFLFQIKPFSSVGLAFGGGLGIQYYLGKHFYLEGNVDYIHAKFNDMNLGMVYPSLGFGGKF